MKQAFEISGMSCDHCAMRVREALESLAGVQSADVNVEEGLATVESDGELSFTSVAEAIGNAGYELVSARA